VKHLPFVVVAAALVLTAGCGGSDGNDASGADFNKADVTFAQDMTGHHTQAIEMARLASSRAVNADVKDLAERIEAAQGPEISRMKGWLEDWDEPMSSGDGMAGNGMMTEAEMGQLMDAKGPQFDMMFLEMMTEHHKGAIEMAKTELADGKNADAKKLAQAIIDAQTTEVAEMKALLKAV